MIRKITDEFATFVVVFLVILFCVSGMTSCYQKEPPTTGAAEDTTIQTAPTAPAQTETAPSESTMPTESHPIQLTDAPEGYFDDALFIGDSRTVGLEEYGPIPGATYFANSGMSVYSVFSAEAAGTTLQNLMDSRQFGKIYVMLGINELGYDFESTVSKYGELIAWLQQRQPDAIIYVEANLHVSAGRSNRDSIYNNPNLDALNQRISELADGQRIFYLDVNPLFDDESGNLAEEYTFDDTHILGKYYQTWSDWIGQNAAVLAG